MKKTAVRIVCWILAGLMVLGGVTGVLVYLIG